MRHPKSILEDVMDALEKKGEESLLDEVSRAWQQLPSNQTLIEKDDSVYCYLKIENEESKREAIYELAMWAAHNLLQLVENDVETSLNFPVDEARRRSIEKLHEELEDVVEVARKDKILFSREKMPKNNVAVSRIINRMIEYEQKKDSKSTDENCNC